MDFFNYLSLASGLGMFLYGMSIMGAGLERLASGKMEAVLKRLTSNIFMGALLGTGVTAVIQSSSATEVIVIGLVNSGIMDFRQALGIIIGANLGTTITGQIIRLSDISSATSIIRFFKPATLAPIAIIVGAIFFVFIKSRNKRNIGQIFIGFGILFTGVITMEQSVLPLREAPWFIAMLTGLRNPITGILAGAAVTAIIQSSSASVGILQAMTSTGLVTWSSAVPIIFGQNIGACFNGLIASIGTKPDARRVAVARLVFNTIGVGVWFAAIYGYREIAGISFWDNKMNMGDVANFHTLFSVGTMIMFLPIPNVLKKICEIIVPDKQSDAHPELTPVVLDDRLYASPTIAVTRAADAVRKMGQLALLIVRDTAPVLEHYDAKIASLSKQRKRTLEQIEMDCSNYLLGISRLELPDIENKKTTTYLQLVYEFSRIGAYAENIMEQAEEKDAQKIAFSDAAKTELAVLMQAVCETVEIAGSLLSPEGEGKAMTVEPLEETVDDICDTLRARHIERLKRAQCSIEAGVYFLEILINYERLSDHCSNVAARMMTLEESGKLDIHNLIRNMHAGSKVYGELREMYANKYRV